MMDAIEAEDAWVARRRQTPKVVEWRRKREARRWAAQVLRSAMRREGLTSSQLAEITRTNYSTVKNWLAGTCCPRTLARARVCRVLGLDPWEVV